MSAAAQRLARTRLAIVDYVQRPRNGPAPPPASPGAGERGQGHAVHGPWAGLKSAARAWWENHPARKVLDLAQPVVIVYAVRRPFRLLALCAACGALIVLARPWRLLSATGVLMAAIRSPSLSSRFLSALLAGGGRARESSPP